MVREIRRRQQALEAVEGSRAVEVSGGASEVWREQQGLEAVARSGGSGKLWKRVVRFGTLGEPELAPGVKAGSQTLIG